MIVDEAMLDRFRGPGACELCGAEFPVRVPHHLFARGVGGGGRVDIPENLVSLGPEGQWKCRCHHLIHNGSIPRRCVLAVVAIREGKTIEEIENAVYAARRAGR